jgi:glycerol transport system ATP-binding protein
LARITLHRVAHSYRANPGEPSDFALHPMDQSWEDGGAYALLGPSGCGKTTLLNVISGLVTPTQGRIAFDGRDVTALPTRERNIAQVFQFPVVYDTMTVADNLAFPLRNRGIDAGTIRARVAEVAEMLDLTADLHRPAHRLDADAKQKISLGRGLVRSDVSAILLDEPLTVIDPHLKWLLRRKLKEIHERFRRTLIYVTHDQNEALTFAQQVVVMYEGEVLQLGTPRELFENPKHLFVGYFIGSPGMNFLPCRPEGDGVAVGDVRIGIGNGGVRRLPEGAQDLKLGIRPEFLELVDGPTPGAVPAAVRAVEDLGNFQIADVVLGTHALKVKLPEGFPVPGSRAHLRFPPDRIKLYLGNRLLA